MSRRTTRQASQAATAVTKEVDIETNGNTESSPRIPQAKATKRKAAKAVVEEQQETETAVVKDEAKSKKRKTTKDKAEDAVPLAERTVISSLKKSMYIGAHVSSAGGRP